MNTPVRIAAIEGWSVRAPIKAPVVTSFGIMTDRPTVFLRVRDQDGHEGWGEVFANWPAAGAEHRINLLQRDFADLLIGTEVEDPQDLFYALTEKTRIRALQCGEEGPFRQIIAGLDIALWDLFARRKGLSMRKYLNSEAMNDVPVYASGIHLGAAPQMIETARNAGYERFKVKVGFDLSTDIKDLNRLLGAMPKGETLAADANQAWSIDQSLEFVTALSGAPLEWLEEPMPVFAPAADWARLETHTTFPLAGGENIAGFDDFITAIDQAHLKVIQPDIMKWGGFTGCFKVAKDIRAAGLRYCPHYLGGGIGLAASAELLAAVGGEGVLELDANPNPLREAFDTTTTRLNGRAWVCDRAPGLGIDALPQDLQPLITGYVQI